MVINYARDIRKGAGIACLLARAFLSFPLTFVQTNNGHLETGQFSYLDFSELLNVFQANNIASVTGEQNANSNVQLQRSYAIVKITCAR